MLLKTLLNHVEPIKGFVYDTPRKVGDHIEVGIRSRKRSKAYCSGCGQLARGYDHLAERLFQFVPLWGIPVFFRYAMRRVDCKDCGVKVECVPWAEGFVPRKR